MSEEIKKSELLKRIVLHCAKWPVIYMILGTILTLFSYIDDIFPLMRWKDTFNLSDKFGSIFIALAFITFVYNLCIFLCLHYEKKLALNHKVAAFIMSSFRKGSRIIFVLVTINVVITIINPSKSYSMFANSIIDTILIGSIGWIVIQILYAIEALLFQNMSSLTIENHVRVKALYTKMHIIRNIGTVVVVVITTAAVLMSFSSVRNIGISLLASAGFLTALVGLSAQKTLVSLFSGLQIVFAQPIKIGDIVLIEKESGIIEEITFTYVTLKLGDRRRLVVPISYFIEKPFENWSHEGHSIRNSLHFHVDYRMPIEALREEFHAILQRSPYWDGAAKKLQVCNLTDKTVEVRVQVSAATADNLSDLRAEVREKILLFMQKNYPNYFPNTRNQNIATPHEIEIS